MPPGRRALFIWTALTLLALAGCSSPVHRTGQTLAASPRAAAGSVAPARTADDIAIAALDGQALAKIRGGYSNSSGLIVSFSFQQATFVNDNLAQSVIVPTFTVSPDSPAAAIITVAGNGSVLPAGFTAGNATTQVQLSSSAATVQSTINNGLTQILSSLGTGGLTNTVSNSANNQLVRQVTTADIDIAGLSKLLQPSVAATVVSQLRAANAQFR